MENKYGIVGVAHVGLPTNDLQKTVEFYKSLGFEEIMQTYNEKAGEKVAFLQIKNYCIETFENGQAAMSDGAYQHVALDVEDIENCASHSRYFSDELGALFFDDKQNKCLRRLLECVILSIITGKTVTIMTIK